MKSELTGEDVDGNGRPGETFSARISASATIGVYLGDAFDTPTVQGSISVGAASDCQPAACDCIDLGDIEATFEPARACTVTVQATYSGVNIIGSEGPLMPGDAIAGAKLTGSLSGQVAPQIDPTLADASGIATFIVPVIGKTPKIELRAHYSTTVDGETHYYDGSLVVDACARATASVDAGTPSVNDAGADAGVDAPVAISLEAQHAGLGSLSDFIASLGAGPAVPSGGGGPNIPSVSAPKIKKPSCGCRTVGFSSDDPQSNSAHWALAALALAAFARRKRPTG